MVAYMHLYHHNKYLCIVVTPSFVELQPKTLQYLFFSTFYDLILISHGRKWEWSKWTKNVKLFHVPLVENMYDWPYSRISWVKQYVATKIWGQSYRKFYLPIIVLILHIANLVIADLWLRQTLLEARGRIQREMMRLWSRVQKTQSFQRRD